MSCQIFTISDRFTVVEPIGWSSGDSFNSGDTIRFNVRIINSTDSLGRPRVAWRWTAWETIGDYDNFLPLGSGNVGNDISWVVIAPEEASKIYLAGYSKALYHNEIHNRYYPELCDVYWNGSIVEQGSHVDFGATVNIISRDGERHSIPGTNQIKCRLKSIDPFYGTSYKMYNPARGVTSFDLTLDQTGICTIGCWKMLSGSPVEAFVLDVCEIYTEWDYYEYKAIRFRFENPGIGYEGVLNSKGEQWVGSSDFEAYIYEDDSPFIIDACSINPLYKAKSWEWRTYDPSYIGEEWRTDSRGSNSIMNLSFSEIEDICNGTPQCYFRCKFVRRRNCKLQVSVPNPDYGTVTLSRSPDYTNPDSWLDGEITFICTPNTGYRPVNIALSDMNYGKNGGSLIPVVGLDGKYRATFDLNYDCEAVVNFDPVVRTAKAVVDSPSKRSEAGVAVVDLVEEEDGGVAELICKDSDVVKFVATPRTGFEFVGWYKEDGTPAPDSVVRGVTYTYTNPVYIVEMTDSVSLVAKFGVQIKVESSPSATAHGSVALNNTTSTTSVTKTVVVGDTYSINATPTTANTDYFAGWYDATDTEFRHVRSSTASKTYTATRSVHWRARFSTSADFVHVALLTDPVTGTYGATWGDDPNNAITEISQSDFVEATGLVDSVPPTARKFYRLPIFGAFTVSVIPSTLPNGCSSWDRAVISGGHIGSLTREDTTQFVDEFYFTQNGVLYVQFVGSGAKKTHTRVKGGMVVSMSGKEEADRVDTKNSLSAKYALSATTDRSESVLSKAIDTNGVVFSGWYLDPDFLRPMVNVGQCDYLDKEFVVPCVSNLTLYCKAVADSNAIFAWEGDSSNKRMRWTSKTYISSRPFDVVSARVDSDGYSSGSGLKVSAAMFSSPNQSQDEADIRSLEIANQDSRRFERGRPERYLQVTVESKDAVNAVFVGTNAKDLGV